MAPRRRTGAFSLGALVLVFLGACIMFYPSAASWFAAVDQARDAGRYVSAVNALQPGERAGALADAQAYNASLASGSIMVDPFAAVQDQTIKTNDPYWSLLDPSGDGIMARVKIPALELNVPVYHGTGADVLLKGVGHLQGTALPTGRPGSHSVLTGHRGLPQATLFSELDKVNVGDSIEVEVFGQTAFYQVISSAVVLPSETDSLRPEAGRDLLTLVTCTPLGVNSHRILVTAERVDGPAGASGTATSNIGFPWWALILALVLVAGIVHQMRGRRRDAVPSA